jgi:hypothetical protein
MAIATISNISNAIVFSVEDLNPTTTPSNIKPFNSTLSNIALGTVFAVTALTNSVVVSDLDRIVSSFEKVNYANVITPTSVLPFRVRLESIGIEGYNPANPPGIGIQIIGFSNYLL